MEPEGSLPYSQELSTSTRPESHKSSPHHSILPNSVALVRERTIPSDRRFSAKLVPTFADEGVSHGQCGGSPTAVISVF
jgi:hypothetical protein